MNGTGVCWGSVEEVTLTTRPPRMPLFQPGPRLPARRMAPLVSPSARQEGWVHRPLAAFNRRTLGKRRLAILPLHTAPAAVYVVSSTAAALKMLHRGRLLSRELSLTTSNTPGCVSAVALCMAAGLVALALQRAFWGYIRLH